MHGQKKRRKRDLDGSFDMEGCRLRWELVSEPQWTSDGYKGLCVAVRLAAGDRRELLIEFPYDRTAFLPQRPKLTGAVVEAVTGQAMLEGWDPQARGRPLVFRTDTELQPRQRSVPRLSHLAR